MTKFRPLYGYKCVQKLILDENSRRQFFYMRSLKFDFRGHKINFWLKSLKL